MLRKDLEKEHGINWWKREYKVDFDHMVKLCVRGIDEKIVTMLKCGVICSHPENPKRLLCIHKDSDGDYYTLIFIPSKNSNIVITGFRSRPEHIDIYERVRGGS